MAVYYYKDRFVESADALVPIEDRAFNYGDGIYEVIRYYGGRGLGLAEHLGRLADSAAAIRLQLPYPLERIGQIANEAAHAVAADVVDVYFQISRGEAPRLHSFPNAEPVLALFAKQGKTYEREFRQRGIAVIVLPDERWMNCYIKSLNLLPNVLAKQTAIDAGALEAVLVRDGWVTEGSSSNVFGFHDGVFYTAPANRSILNGITRRYVIAAIRQLGYPLREEPMSASFFENTVEAAFVTSTTMEVMPICSINGRALAPVGDASVVWQLLDVLHAHKTDAAAAL